MQRKLNSNEHKEILEKLQSQFDYIKYKKSIRISLQEYSPTTTLGAICEALVVMLAQHEPPLHLERISVSDNQIHELPGEFIQLCSTHLRTLDLHNNQLTEVPGFIASSCPNLEKLDLSSNIITFINRTSLGPLKNLQILSLKDNRITHLPTIIGEMINLEQLVVSGNPLKFPSIDTINGMSGGIDDLKAFLASSTVPSDPKVENHTASRAKLGLPTTPGLSRAHSLSDTRSRSSKASRRMGLIVNSNNGTSSNKVTSDKAPSLSEEIQSLTPSKPARKLSFPTATSGLGIFSEETKVQVLSSSNGMIPAPKETIDVISRSGSPSRNSSISRRTKGVLKSSAREKDHIPDENFDGDAKPAAYFRRLSTLRESPSDGNICNGVTDEQAEAEAEVEADVEAEAEVEVEVETETGPRAEAGAEAKSMIPRQGSDVATLKIGKRPSISSSTPPGPSQQSTPKSQTTRNGTVHENAVIVKVSRKILFSFSEVHSSIKRFAGFCGDKKLSVKIVRLIQASKAQIDDLVESMEAAESGEESQNSVIDSLHACIQSFKTLLATISENLSSLVARIDACFIRMVLLTLFGSLHELQNAHRLLNQSASSSKPSLTKNSSSLSSNTFDPKGKQLNEGMLGELVLETPSISSATEAVSTLEEIDERLYQTIGLATANAQVVFSDLTRAISKSAIATATNENATAISPLVAAKFKELTHVCMSSMDITKRLSAKLQTIRSSQDSTSKRLFWDDINLFLKSVIQTFSAVKDIMRDAPIFNEVRGSMANLTKTTKELTIILEASSYKSISDSVTALPSNNVWHMSNGPPASSTAGSFNPQSQVSAVSSSIPPIRTPLEATVGTAAAQAILSQHDSSFSKQSFADSHPSNIPLNMPHSVVTDYYNNGLHTAPAQSMEQFCAKNINPFDRL